jgi:hypothetical protein
MNFCNFCSCFQEKIKKLREDWKYVKNRGEEATSQDAIAQGAAASTVYSPKVQTGKKHVSA